MATNGRDDRADTVDGPAQERKRGDAYSGVNGGVEYRDPGNHSELELSYHAWLNKVLGSDSEAT